MGASGAEGFTVVDVGSERKYKCKVCNTLSNSRQEYDQHKEGWKHKEAKKSYCPHCRIHCYLCDVHSSGPQPWRQHILSKQHRNKLDAATAPTNASPGVSPPSAGVLQCPACQQDFAELAELKDHVKTNHDILLTCTECETRGHQPRGEALFCQELMEHYSKVHNKKMAVSDLPYYGKKGGEKMKAQGYVVCQLCPTKPSYQTLGRPGLWFTNKLSLPTIRSHFTKHHPGKENYLEEIVLGCQLCRDQLPGSRGEARWIALLHKHSQDDTEEEGENSAQPSPRSVLTRPCPYCGEILAREGEAAQRHIKQRHLELTFSCKLCRMGDRYYYQAIEDVYRHLRLKHFDFNRINITNVILPGSRSNLEAFARVKCKICDFKGIGGGQEVRDHLQRHGGGDKDLEIFSRLCHREDTLNVNTFEDFKEFVDHFQAGHGDIVSSL